MALQEKEFAVKNGIDIKNSVLKLGGVSPGPAQLIGGNAGSNGVEIKTITNGSGISVNTSSPGFITISTTGELPVSTTAANLTVGKSGTWTRTTNVVSVVMVLHGLTSGVYYLSFPNGQTNSIPSGTYTITVTGTGTFTFPHTGTNYATPQTIYAEGSMSSYRVLGVGVIAADAVTITGKANSAATKLLSLSDFGAVERFSVDTSGNTIAATVNKVTITQPATGSTLTIANGKTLTVSNTITFTAGADSQSFALPAASTTLAGLGTSQSFTNTNTFTNTNSFTANAVGYGVTISNAGAGKGMSIDDFDVSGVGTFAAGLVLSGTASNITLGSNFISNGGTDAGLSLDGTNNATISGTLTVSNATGITATALTSTGALSLNSATTNAITIGSGANTKTISIGNTTVGTEIELIAGTGTGAVGGVQISSTAAETTATYASMTGALKVAGGIGATGNSYFGGTLNVSSTASIGTSLTITGTPSLIAGTIGNTVSIFNTSTGTVNIATASTGTINIGSATSTVDCGGFLQHGGLSMSAGNNVDQTVAFTSASIVLNQASWTDSGISGTSQLTSNGIYVFKLQVAASNEWYMGVMPWYSANGHATQGDEYSEIPLTKYSDGNEAGVVYARVLRVASAAPKIQLSANATRATQTYTFTFRKLIA